ncbi:hypothetical protein cypCar_00025873 [Cyprinus carpio]|nr:hypothetical protein cypCar_00025873 [Cyprinus carpio]
MRVPVQIFLFSCFLFSVTFVQGQECLGEDITYENTQPVVNVSYADGETVKVNCMTGYIGFYKLKCKNGQWLTFIARRCSSKKTASVTTSFYINLKFAPEQNLHSSQ